MTLSLTDSVSRLPFDISVFRALQSFFRHLTWLFWQLIRRQRQRKRRWERFCDLVILQICHTVNCSWQIEKLEPWHRGFVTNIQRVTWKALATPAMFSMIIDITSNIPQVVWRCWSCTHWTWWRHGSSCRAMLFRGTRVTTKGSVQITHLVISKKVSKGVRE